MAKKNTDLQPKDGDFFAYIEKMQEQKASELKASVQNDSSRFAQEIFKSNDQSLQKARENVKKVIQADLGVQDPNKDILAGQSKSKSQIFPGSKDTAFVKSAGANPAQAPKADPGLTGIQGSSLNDAEILKSYQDLLRGSGPNNPAGTKAQAQGTFQRSQSAGSAASGPWQSPGTAPGAGFEKKVSNNAARQKYKPQGKSRAYNTRTRLNKDRPASRVQGFFMFLFFAALLGVSSYIGNPYVFIAFLIFCVIGNIIFTKKRNKSDARGNRRNGPQG